MTRLLLAAVLAAVLAPSASAQPTTDDVFPFREGNRWIYDNYEQQSRLDGSSSYFSRGTTEWEVLGTVDTPGGALPRLEIRRNGGDPTVCAVQVRSDDEQLAFDLLTPDGSALCDAGTYIAPSPMFDFDFPMGLRADAFSEQTAQIGGIDYTVSAGRGNWPGSEDDAWLDAAVGIGVVAFDERRSFLGGNLHIYGSALRYAMVDGSEYGSLTVADEAQPDASTLSLAVGPNPVRASAQLFISGDARVVRVTVLDALGRTVEAREATAGTLTLDTSRWAVGVYVVRAESADGVATARLTVAR